MKKAALSFAFLVLLGIGLSASNNPVTKETENGKTVEVEVVTEGSINLFSQESEVLPATIPEDPMESYTKTYTTYYISKGNNELIELHCANYKDVLASYMNDKPEVSSQVGKKGYKFNELEDIIEDYNKN